MADDFKKTAGISILIKPMAKTKITLKKRIITLMVISTIALISVFTVIQLNNHLSSLTLYNSYQARLSAMLVKNTLQETIKSMPAEDPAIGAYLQRNLDYLTDLRIIEQAIIIDENDEIIASTDKSAVGQKARTRDMVKRYRIASAKEKDRLFELEIDKARRILDIFILLDKEVNQRANLVVKLSSSIGNIKDALIGVYKPAITTSILVIIANIIIGFMLSKIVVGPIKILNEATKVIASGRLETRVVINTDDELEELSHTFNEMASALKKMTERAENANPLTKLPGNIVIREEIEKRINQGRKFMVIHADLDNFKAYNDCYGLAKGDEAIKLTAQILKQASQTRGSPDDLLGHEGGDDFILITTPEKADDIGDYIITEFDNHIKEFYDQEDAKQGFIVAESRQGETCRFPIMTISLSGVTNEHRPITSYAEVTNIAAEVKKKAKQTQKSTFIIDQRKSLS